MAPQATPTITDVSSTTAAARATCTTAVRGKYGSVPIDACDSYYNYVPNFEAAIAFGTLFGIVTLIHFIQAICYRKVSDRSLFENASTHKWIRVSVGSCLFFLPKGQLTRLTDNRILAAIWETASFALRALGDRDQDQLGWIIGSQLLLLLSPLCE